MITCGLPLNILKAEDTDAEDILKLQFLSYISEAEIYNDYNIPPLTQTLEELKKEFSYKVFLKAVYEGGIIGTVRGYENNGTVYIERLAVHPGFRGKGAGTALMGEIERVFHSSRFELFTGYKSLDNIRLYERLDYSIFKREPLGRGNIELVYMEKVFPILK